MTSVLALRALGLGDTYAAVPALRALRRGVDGARLVLAGPESWGGLLVEQGVVDAVLPAAGLAALDWDLGPPDLAVNLHGSGPESHQLLQRLRPGRLVAFSCAAAGFTDGPQWDAEEHEVARWIRLARELGGTATADDLRLPPPSGAPPHPGAVVVHPGAAFGSRRWPVERWSEVVAELLRAGLPVVVTGTADEVGLTSAVAAAGPGAVDLGGELTPRALAQLVGAARLLLSADTGVAHLATAYRTPSVTLFGPTPPAQWGPAVDRELHETVWLAQPGDLPGTPHGSEVDVRLARITPSDVLRPARRLLDLPVPQHS
ncbi:glycosyl transferase [Intrasporangium chromatireducens Q5-1]|uniref:Glycosyl transferase n=1 Tax=Intrasporangium chromatireducens Q5-1 TaxID=584657 RepID=W9GHT4_9MICO|nr:glycosyltransferase family 9 protein [Intrasporangium chromatireducens]EWT04727.1 glycosyl transferase [Intrasporangium chromatireducens Q5-1]